MANVAIDIPRRRIYIRGPILEAYTWLCEYFDQWHMMTYGWFFYMIDEETYEPTGYWLIEHNPEPLVCE